MAKQRIDGLTFKAGPTQSGAVVTPTPPPYTVGGEALDINLISVIASKYWPLLLLMLIPLAFVLYKKRSTLPKYLYRLKLLRGL